MLRTAVSISDLIRAVRTLRPDESTTVDQIAALMGLTVSMAPAPTAAPEPPPIPPPTPPPPSEPSVPTEQLRASEVQRTAQAVSHDVPARATRVDPLPRESAFNRPPREVPPLDVLLKVTASARVDGETTLFVRQWQRGVLTALISVLTPSGGLDIARIVEQIARRSAVQQLPRRAVYTTRKGLQILVDAGKGMWPYSSDVSELEKLLRLTAGQDSVHVMRFDQTPTGGVGRGTRRNWKAYEPPAPGTPVLVVSDFGLARPFDGVSLADGWEPVARAAIGRCPLLGLTPFPQSRWPAWLTDTFAVLQWDRAATAALARRAAERASRKGR